MASVSKRIDLLNGGIVSPLIRLALPIMGTSLIQMAYNMVDMIWVGRIGSGAVAAVGSAGMFMWLSNGLMILARLGGQVNTAQKLGAGDIQNAARYTTASMQLGTLFSLFYTALMLLFSRPLISFFRLTAPEVNRDAVTYLQIVALGTCFSFLNQILTSIITTTGNSRTPFLTMTTGLVFNIALDPLLIFGLGPLPALGAAGAAWATVLAQALVFLLFRLYIRKDRHLFAHVKFFSRPQFSIWMEIFRVSLPMAVQSSLFPIISMVVARIIAGWGDGAVAAQKVGNQVESVSWMMADGFSVAVNSFIAQNVGAGNFPRAKRVWRTSMGIASIWGLICGLLLYFAGGFIFSVFIPDPAILPIGTDYLRIQAFCEILLCWEIITIGAYSGFGHTLTPSLVSIIFTAMRIPGSLLLSATPLGLSGVWWSMSISCMIKGLLLVSLFLLFLRRTGRRMAKEAG